MTKEKLTNILLVEDDADIREVAELSLRSIGGFNLTVCSSGEEALKELTSITPQMILLDVMMPGMDGPTVYEHIKQIPRLSKIPVIFMTAKVHPGETNNYRRLGAVEVIAKPFDPLSLPETLVNIWERTP